MACWPVKVQTEGCMHLNLNYSINYGGDHILLMSVIYGGRQSCMIDVIYCGCPSLMNMMDVHHVWRMDASHICMYDGCPSYLMFYSHKFPSYMWTSFVMEAMESFSRRNELKKIWWILKYICNWWNRKRENVGNMKLI